MGNDTRLRHEPHREREDETASGNAEMFVRIFKHAPIGIVMASPDFRLRKVNRAFCDMLGYSEGELLGRTFQDVTFPEDRPLSAEAVGRVLKGETETFQIEKRYVRKDGGVVWGLVFGFVIRDDGGAPLYMSTQVIDVTERKHAEQELRRNQSRLCASEERLKEAERLARLGHWEWEIGTQTLHWSDEVYRIFGLDPASFRPSAEAFEAAIHPDDREAFLETRARMLAEQQRAVIDHRIVLPTGDVRHVQERTQIVLDNGGQTVRVAGTVQDITDAKAVEARLARERENFQTIFRAAPVGMLLFGSDEMVRDANAAISTIVRCGGAEALGKRCGEAIACVHHDDDPRGCGFSEACATCPLRAAVRNILASGESVHGVEVQAMLRENGRSVDRWFKVSAEPLHLDGERHVAVAIDDITAQKVWEDALHRSEARNKALVRALPDLMFVFDREGRFIDYDAPEKTALAAPPEAFLGHNIRDVLPRDIAEGTLVQIDEVIRCGNAAPFVYQLEMEGERRIYESRIVPCGDDLILAIVRDITDRERAETKIREQLDELQRWHNVMLNREGRVQELKREVNEMCARLGEAPRYESQLQREG